MSGKSIVGYTVGGFDQFGIGHVNFLRNAKKQCDRLIVGVQTDEVFTQTWSRDTEVPFEERVEIVRALGCVDEVCTVASVEDLDAAWARYRFDVLFVGEDAKDSAPLKSFERKHGVRVEGLTRTITCGASFKPPASHWDVIFTRSGHFDAYIRENDRECGTLESRLTAGLDDVSRALATRIQRMQQEAYAVMSSLGQEVWQSKYLGKYVSVDIPLLFDRAETEEWERNQRDFAAFPGGLDRWSWPDEVVASSHHLQTFLKYSHSHIQRQLTASIRSLYFIDKKFRRVEGRDVLDCGANVGDSALIYSTESPRSVHAFEPARETFENLKKVLAANGKSDVIVPVNLATGATGGTVRFHTYFNDGAASVIDNGNATESYEVNRVTIDDYVRENGLDVGLIKMDIEGAEYDTIVGATETIQKFKPNLIISIYHTPKDFFEIKPYLESLDLGYEFRIRQLPLFRQWTDEVELIAYVK